MGLATLCLCDRLGLPRRRKVREIGYVSECGAPCPSRRVTPPTWVLLHSVLHVRGLGLLVVTVTVGRVSGVVFPVVRVHTRKLPGPLTRSVYSRFPDSCPVRMSDDDSGFVLSTSEPLVGWDGRRRRYTYAIVPRIVVSVRWMVTTDTSDRPCDP